MNTTKKSVYKRQLAAPKSFLNFHSKKFKSFPSATSNISRSAMAYMTTASLDILTFTDYGDLANAKTESDVDPITWMYNSKFSKRMTTKFSDWYKVLQRKRQISIN